jgi:hypothetical protein
MGNLLDSNRMRCPQAPQRADFTAQETFDKVTLDLVAGFDLFDHFAKFCGSGSAGYSMGTVA